jgi:hypothetical protein
VWRQAVPLNEQREDKCMADLGLKQAFGRYKADLSNPMWQVSAMAEDGSLVMSCWTKYLATEQKVMRYTDRLSRWGNNKPGNNLLKEHLTRAYETQLPVRLIMAKAENDADLDGVVDASKIKKTFHVRDDVVGKVVKFDGDNFVIDFRRPGPLTG